MTEAALDMSLREKPGVGTILCASLRLYRDNFLPFLLIGVIGRALFVVVELLSATALSQGLRWLHWLGLAFLLPGYVIGFWAGAAMIIAASDTYSGQESNLRKSFAQVAESYWNYVAATVLYWLLGAAGLLLLVFPAAYLGTVFCLVGYVAVLERTSGLSAFGRSRQLVRGSFWRVFLIMLLLAAVRVVPKFLFGGIAEAHGCVGPIASNAYGILVWPFWTAAHVVLYHQLAKAREEPQPSKGPEAAGKKRMGCLLTFFGAVVLIIVIFVLVVSWGMILGGLFP